MSDYVRPPGIGSSMVGVIALANPYASPVDLWEELTGAREPFTGNLDTKIGQALEPVIAEEYSALYGRKLEKGQLVHHPSHDWAFATPDYIVENPDAPQSVLEIKNSRFKSREGGPHCLRAAYRLQLRWQLACCNLPRGEIFIHCMAAPKDQRFELITVERDLQIERGLIELCRLFWEHVQKRIPLPEQFHRAA